MASRRIVIPVGFLTLLLSFTGWNMAYAQQTVSGTVTDGQSGETLPGVNILVKSTSSGTSTDSKGHYQLEVASLQDTLVFSFVGYQTRQVPIAGRTAIDVALQSQAISGEEMVVVGYGAQKKSDLTGSVGSVGEEALEKSSPTNVQEGLAGKITGVEVTQNSGRPGGRATIRIRGNSSITGSNKPLYVVDGVIVNTANLANGTSPIDYLDPDNVKSIDVLKDASATAIYGARGSNGVILITTKRGANHSISYNGSVGVGTLPRELDLLNAEEFLHIEDIAFQNAGKYGLSGSVVDPATKRTDPRLFDSAGNPLYNTDWQKAATRAALTNNQHLSFNGGDANNSYGVTLGYRNQEGLIRQSFLKRFSGRLYVNSQINDWITAGGSINYSFSNQSQPRNIGSGGITPTRSMLQALPITPVKYPDGSFGETLDYPGVEGGAQPVRLVNQRKRLLDTHNTIGNVHINLELTNNLELKSTLGVNIIDQKNKYFAEGDLLYISQNGNASISDEQNTSWQFENQLTYKTNLSDNQSFKGLMGISWQRVNQFSSSDGVEDFDAGFFKFNNLGAASNPQPPGSNASAYSLNSYFGRVNYTLDNRYLFTLTGRIDGSSRFSKENQYAFFPSGALGWVISNEDFLEDNPVISNLKLRASYGITGNSEIPNYRTVTTLGNYSYVINGQRVVGTGIASIANPNLKWERNRQANVGIDLGLLNGRITLEGDIYYKKSTDILLNAPIPATSGYTSAIRNIGSMENRGIELNLNTTNITRSDFSWNTTFNISMNRNKVLHLVGGQDILQGGNPITGKRIIREGKAANSFYGYIQLGTWNTDQAKQAAKYNRVPGDIRYKDINNDNAINEQDRVIIGNGLPKGYGSLINTFVYKNFGLTIDLQYEYGNDVEYGTKSTTQDRTGITNVFSTVLNAWTPDNQDTPIPQIRPTGAYIDRQNSSARIYNGSFVRGRNILLAYNFSPKIIDKWDLKKLRIYASAQNFFLIMDYPGYDPEVSASTSNFAQGVDLYSYPKPRVFLLGLSFSL